VYVRVSNEAIQKEANDSLMDSQEKLLLMLSMMIPLKVRGVQEDDLVR
jgi:hypothetical protein